MLEMLNRKLFPKKTVIILLFTIVLIGMLTQSALESSEKIKGYSTSMVISDSNNARRKCRTCSTFSIDSNTRTVIGETKSVVNQPYTVGYTENGLPLVKIYDYFQVNETEEEKIHRFEQIKPWLDAIPKTQPEVISKCTSSTKRILWLDIWHNGFGVRNKCRKVDFSQCDCSCEVDFFVFNDTEKLYDPFGADAVMFQINKLIYLGHPPLKHQGQVFVAVEREATPIERIPTQNFEYLINWTMTFRQDSDIGYPYGRIIPRTGTSPVKDYSDIYKKKKKGIIWFVSHCSTKSNREDYAKELSKYIDLDIVGACGRDICPRHSNKCADKFEEEYFFRFNFENTYHTDYVTEKLFENFSTDMIQIVGGSAEYDKIAPNNTVIDVADFNSPKDLAAYLKHLMNSEELYIEYLKTKDNYYSETLGAESQMSYCQLCSMLHDPDRYRNLYYSVGDWFLSPRAA